MICNQISLPITWNILNVLKFKILNIKCYMILTLKGSDQIRLFMILFHFMACVNYPFDLDNFFFFSMTFYFQILTRLFI